MDLQLDFMVNNAPKGRWQGVSKHNVLNLLATIQESRYWPQRKIHAIKNCLQNITSSVNAHQMLWLWQSKQQTKMIFYYFNI